MRRDDAGTLAVVVALFATTMFILAALVVDMTAVREVRSEVQAVADSAALAGASQLDRPGGTTARGRAVGSAVRRYADANLGPIPARTWRRCDIDLDGDFQRVPQQRSWRTDCVAWGNRVDGRYTTVQVVVPARETDSAFGGVVGYDGGIRALARAQKSRDTAGFDVACVLCLDDLDGDEDNLNVNGALDTSVDPDPLEEIQNLLPPVNGTQWAQPATTPPAGPCVPGNYVTVTSCTSFSPGVYVIAGGAVQLNASTPEGTLFYFTCQRTRNGVTRPRACNGREGATFRGVGGAANLTFNGWTADDPYKGFAMIFDPRNEADHTLTGVAGSRLTVNGAIYNPDDDSEVDAGGPGFLDVHGIVMLGRLEVDATTGARMEFFDQAEPFALPVREPGDLRLTK